MTWTSHERSMGAFKLTVFPMLQTCTYNSVRQYLQRRLEISRVDAWVLRRVTEDGEMGIGRCGIQANTLVHEAQ